MRKANRIRRAIAKWWPWGAVVLGVSLAAALGFAVQQGLHRVETSRAYCTSCHAGHGRVPGHAEASCQSCHSLPRGQRLRFVWAIVDGDAPVPDHGDVDPASCRRCHERDDVAWASLMRTDGHALHARNPDAMPCTRCHGASLHGQPDPQEGCLSCHGDVPLRSEPRAESQCIVCHVFGTDGRRAAAGWAPSGQDTGAWSSRVTVDQVHGAADCRLCHNPHEPPVETSAMPACTSCHRGRVAATAALGPEQHGTCTSCHQVHGERAALPTLCIGCHARPGERAASKVWHQPFVGDRGEDDSRASASPPSHAKQGGVTTATAPLSLVELQQRTHQGKCPTCHRPHAFVATPDICANCHEHRDKVASLARLPEGTHDQCVDCHEPHQPPPDRNACLGCHNKPLGSGVPVKHRDCLSCHDPHTPRPSFVDACSSRCHGEPVRGVRSGPKKHRNCGSCHAAHGDPDARSAAACRRCHADKAKSLLQSPHRQCIACHAPHSFEKEAASARCGACHTQPTAPGASHPGECASCHAVHGGPQPAADCNNCHEDVRIEVSGHRCNGCHAPHEPAERALSRCASCHRRQVATAASWPADSPHAGACMECHQRHEVKSRKPCGSCHVAQASPAHVGAHPNCRGCHAPHQPPAATPAGWWERCRTCHREEATLAARAAEPAHRECRNCHDRPERKAPPCVTCHESIPKTLLHAEPNHQDCAQCHQTHGAFRPGRAECLGCHRDKKQHNPQATRCQACHPFAQ